MNKVRRPFPHTTIDRDHEYLVLFMEHKDALPEIVKSVDTVNNGRNCVTFLTNCTPDVDLHLGYRYICVHRDTTFWGR